MTTDDVARDSKGRLLPPTWDCWSASECVAWNELQDCFDAISAARKALDAALPKPLPKEIWSLVDNLDNSATRARFCAVEVVRERLRRYLPHLGDLIDYATQNPALFNDLPHGDV